MQRACLGLRPNKPNSPVMKHADPTLQGRVGLLWILRLTSVCACCQMVVICLVPWPLLQEGFAKSRRFAPDSGTQNMCVYGKIWLQTHPYAHLHVKPLQQSRGQTFFTFTALRPLTPITTHTKILRAHEHSAATVTYEPVYSMTKGAHPSYDAELWACYLEKAGRSLVRRALRATDFRYVSQLMCSV